MKINNTDGVYRLEVVIHTEYISFREIYNSKIYNPGFNSFWITTDDSISQSIISKYDNRKGFKNRDYD